jgi:RHS repeat-associated protein
MNGPTHTYSYDANGNMTSGPDLTDPGQVRTRTITYNGENMPAQITVGGNTVDFVYNGSGVRAKKTVNQTNATYYIGQYYEKRNGIITKYIFSGNTRIAKIKGKDVFYFHKDHLGSSTLLTNASGTVVETTEYMPFGGDKSRSGALEANYKYTDQEYDLETGLYNYRARLYDPVIATFITPDSIVPHPSDPQMLNRYAYCRNNPIKYVDPTGRVMDLGGALGGVDVGSLGGLVGSGGSWGFAGSGGSGTIGMYVAQSLQQSYQDTGVTGDILNSMQTAHGWDPNLARPEITVGTTEYRVFYEGMGGGKIGYAEGGIYTLYNDQEQSAFQLMSKGLGAGLYLGGGLQFERGSATGPRDVRIGMD